jgi:NitT/TauT family transport system substrate-binding protein
MLSAVIFGAAQASADTPVRIGHFLSITHAQGVIGHVRSTQAAKDSSREDFFAKRVGVPIEWYEYNAGPSAMEALLAGSIDASYVGPNPVLNLFLKTKGRGLGVLAGSAKGGAGLFVRAGLNLKSPTDFVGRRVASPQFGNTQDVSARSWFVNAGLKVTMTGGDVHIIPTAGPDQLVLLKRQELDGAWTVEPWLSTLENQVGGEVVVDEREALTAVLAVRLKFLEERSQEARALLEAHRELTAWINQNPALAQAEFREGMRMQSGQDISEEIVARSWSRLQFTPEVTPGEFSDFVTKAQAVGFLKDADPALLSSLVREIPE